MGTLAIFYSVSKTYRVYTQSMLITPDQIRAARALKNWSQTDLAERTGLAVPTIANIEAGKQSPGKNTIEKIVNAFEVDGIEFIGSKGVQKRESSTTVFRGSDGMRAFYDDIYHTLKLDNKEVLVGNADEKNFVYHIDLDIVEEHIKRMNDVGAQYRILIKENDYYFAVSDYAQYRWTPEKDFQLIPFYVYGNKLAIILFLRDEHIVFLIDSKEAADVYREKFNVMWNSSITPPNNSKKIRTFKPSDKEEFLKKKAGK